MYKKLPRYDDQYLGREEEKIFSVETRGTGAGYGAHKRYLLRNGKILKDATSGSPLVIPNTISPVLRKNSWATIEAVLQAGKMDECWEIGDYKVCYRHEKDNGGNIIKF